MKICLELTSSTCGGAWSIAFRWLIATNLWGAVPSEVGLVLCNRWSAYNWFRVSGAASLSSTGDKATIHRPTVHYKGVNPTSTPPPGYFTMWHFLLTMLLPWFHGGGSIVSHMAQCWSHTFDPPTLSAKKSSFLYITQMQIVYDSNEKHTNKTFHCVMQI